MLPKKDWQGKITVITGASSGIGTAIARTFAAKGLLVVLVARRVELLEALAGEIRKEGNRAEVLVADLGQEAARLELYQEVTSRWGCPQVLVNNAGFGWYGYYTDMAWETARDMLTLNVEAVIHLTRLFLPRMKECREGHILNIGSIAGQIPSQGIACYAASKAYLNAFTTCLYRELRGSGVEASLLCPGPVRTGFYKQALAQPNGRAVPSEGAAIPAEQVAQVAWSILVRPRRVAYIPWWLCLTPWVELFFGGIMDRLGPLLLRRPTA